MNEKFTPGPWVYKGAVITVQSLHGDICDLVTEYNGKQMPFESNGFLISAAPAMYEFGETTAEVLQLLISYLGPTDSGLNAEIKRLAEERIAEWKKIEKKANGEEIRK